MGSGTKTYERGRHIKNYESILKMVDDTSFRSMYPSGEFLSYDITKLRAYKFRKATDMEILHYKILEKL